MEIIRLHTLLLFLFLNMLLNKQVTIILDKKKISDLSFLW